MCNSVNAIKLIVASYQAIELKEAQLAVVMALEKLRKVNQLEGSIWKKERE